MSYIIEEKNPLLLTKLTAKGREKIAQGSLNFKYWSIGDSEVDYNYVASHPLKILKPKDFQPNLKTILEKNGCSILCEFLQSEKKVVECCVRNKAKERGFFALSGNTENLITSNDYIRTTGQVMLSQFNGTLNIDLGTVDFLDSDYIMFKITKANVGSLSLSETTVPVLYLWYKIKKTPLSTIVEVDRLLPYFSFMTDVAVNFYIFPKGQSIGEFYGSGSTIPYWHSETLEFLADCDVSQDDISIMNANNVWNETLAGTSLLHENHEQYGSINYVGQKEYLGYNKDCPEIVTVPTDCEDKLLAVDDDFVKGIGIIHFTNLNISNDYGEKFYINHDENIHLTIKMPTIMWHRRYFGSSESGNILGMNFKTSGNIKTVENSHIEYYDLVEDSTLINPSGSTLIVGRVFPQLKIVAIHDEELLATMSYKASRNFSLPKLKGRMIFPKNGLNTGVLAKGKTMYMTYVMEADNGLRYFLPQQKYLKFINNSKTDRDLEFSLEDTDLLPYMRQFEKAGYDGLGFYAHRFKVLVQIVDNSEDRPLAHLWKSVDYTSNFITNVTSYTINPLLLEGQDVSKTGFTLTKAKYNTGSTYDLDTLYIPELNCDTELQFGDEVFFFGNLQTHIGACIYKSVFTLNINANDFIKSSNPTWTTDKKLWFNEIGIYDSQQELVAITKLSQPIEMITNSKFAVEISLDF